MRITSCTFFAVRARFANTSFPFVLLKFGSTRFHAGRRTKPVSPSPSLFRLASSRALKQILGSSGSPKKKKKESFGRLKINIGGEMNDAALLAVLAGTQRPCQPEGPAGLRRPRPACRLPSETPSILNRSSLSPVSLPPPRASAKTSSASRTPILSPRGGSQSRRARR